MRNTFIALLATCLGAFLEGAPAAAADPVGAAKCAECHADQAQALKSSPHGDRLAAIKGVPFEKTCETCHGPGSAHAGGDMAAIVNPGKLGAKAASACLDCHAGDKQRLFWSGSAHDSKGVSCMSCHKVHGGRDKLLAKVSELETCASCHGEIRAQLLKRSKHPVRDSTAKDGRGKLACSSCHNPHGSQSEKLMAGKSINDTCYKCHGEKKAPLLWEHGPVKEDCTICHTPHGSSNEKLLVLRVPRLCQNCHMQGRHQTGVLQPNSIFASGKSCLNCHTMIHGSNSPSGPVLQR